MGGGSAQEDWKQFEVAYLSCAWHTRSYNKRGCNRAWWLNSGARQTSVESLFGPLPMLDTESPAGRRPLKSRQSPFFQKLAAQLARAGVTPNAISLFSLVFGAAG